MQFLVSSVQIFVRNKDSFKSAVVRRIAERKLTQIATESNPYRVTIAHNHHALLKAFSLVYQEYRKKGLCRPDKSKLYFNKFALSRSTRTLILSEGERCLGTVSIIPDSADGLPLESVFPDEVAVLRAQDARLVEISMLALDTASFPRERSLRSTTKLRGLMSLFAGLYGTIRETMDATHLVIEVHPRHQEIYRMLGFITIGPERSCELVEGKPAVLMYASISKIQAWINSCKAQSFAMQLVPANLDRIPSPIDYLEVALAYVRDAEEKLRSIIDLQISKARRRLPNAVFPRDNELQVN